MGWAARANPVAVDRAAGKIKPLAKEEFTKDGLKITLHERTAGHRISQALNQLATLERGRRRRRKGTMVGG